MQDLISIALDGSGLLLAGSGFTFGATNVDGNSIPNVARLLEILNAPFPCNHYVRYQTAAERFLTERGHAKLYADLRREFRIQAYKPWHTSTMEIPWYRIYTTNYDNLIERVLEDKKIPFKTFNAARDDKLYDPSLTNIIHLNGSFDAVTDINFDALIRLTDASYIAARFSDTPYFSRLRDEMRTAGAIFVIGHSLSELDLAKVIGGDPAFKEKTVVITSPAAGSEETFSPP